MPSIASVYVDVLPSTARVAEGIEKAFREVDRKAFEAGKRWSKEIDRGLAGRHDVDVDVDADTAKAEAKIDAAARDRTAHVELKVDTDRGLDMLARQASTASDALGTQLSGAASSASVSLRGLMSGPGGVAAAAVGIGALAGALGGLAGIAAQASQALLLLPAAVGGIGVGVGALMIGLNGVADAYSAVGKAAADADNPAALKAADDAMAKLAPNARALVGALQSLKPAWEGMSRAVQDALLVGVGAQITTLANTYLPMLQSGMTGAASAFNAMFSALTTELLKPETMSAFQTFLNNVVAAFQNLTPMIGPLVSAFSTLMADGSSFLPELATGMANMAKSFADFIASGDLKTWIGDGLEVLRQLGAVLMNDVIPMLFELKPVGEIMLPMIVSLFKDLHNLMPLIVGGLIALLGPIELFVGQVKQLSDGWDLVKKAMEKIAPFFENWKHPIEDINALIEKMVGKVNGLIDAFNRLPLPDIPHVAPVTLGGGAAGPSPALGGGPGAQAERRGDTGSNPPPSPAPPNGPSPASPPGAQPTATQSSGFNWDAVAAQESSGNWSNADTGHNGHYGGLQFSPETWKLFGGEEFAPMPHQASREQQIIVADRTAFFGYKGVKPQGLGAWEVITQGKVAGVTANTQPPGAAAPAPAAASPSVPTPVTTNTAPAAAAAGGYPGDAVLLARVPAGRYQNPDENPPGSWDLTKGLGDCSSAVEDLVNILTGSSTAGRSLSTSNAAQWLTDHGFVKNTTGANVPGAFNVGYNASHMQATLPGGQNFNYGSNEAAARGGVGGSGAFGEGLTEHWYRVVGGVPTPATPGGPTPALSPANAAAAAVPALSGDIPPGQRKEAKDAGKNFGEQFGKDLVSGIAEVFGFDGSLFKNPAEFGLVKIFAALNKWGSGLPKANGAAGTGGSSSAAAGGGGGNVFDILDSVISPAIPNAGPAGIGNLAPQPLGPPPGPAPGAQVDQSVHMEGSRFGQSATEVGTQIQAGQIQAARPHLRPLPA